MRMFKTAAALYVLAATSGAAADLPSRTAPAILSAVSSSNWSGLYVGAFLGGGNHMTRVGDPEGTFYDHAGEMQSSSMSAFGGLNIGYNFQVRSFVLGIETEGSMFSQKRIQISGDDRADNFFARTKNGFGARVRAGYAFDNYLVFASAGPQWLNSEHSARYGDDCGSTSSVCGNVWQLGMAYGAGLEAVLSPSVSVRFEYLYQSMPTDNRYQNNPASWREVFQFTDTSHTARIGLNYRLGR